MLKAVVSKNKAAFDYWLAGGDIWRRNCGKSHKDSPWQKVSSPNWTGVATTYLQDDIYAEFRMAFADGKEIQLNDGSKHCPLWSKAYPGATPFHTYPVGLYRIAPEAPKFKVGDWVKYIRSDGCGAMQRLGQVREVDGDRIIASNVGYLYPTENFIAWEPEIGDYCWFSNNSGDKPMIGVFNGMGAHDRYSSGIWSYKLCEPFIGTLPTNLKDQ